MKFTCILLKTKGFSRETEAFCYWRWRDKNSQGWVMGIFGATVAISFAIAGAATNLLTLLTPRHIIIIGGILMLLSGLGMFWLHKKHPGFNSTKKTDGWKNFAKRRSSFYVVSWRS